MGENAGRGFTPRDGLDENEGRDSTPRAADENASAASVSHHATGADSDSGDTSCPHCGESQQLAKVKGCIKCLQCGFKFDCNGW